MFEPSVSSSDVNSFTGKYLYSDFVTGGEKENILNSWAKIPVIGIAVCVAKVALGIIHTFGHLFAALFTLKKGHLFHASKGACETLKATIGALPIVGRIFVNCYNPNNLSSGDSGNSAGDRLDFSSDDLDGSLVFPADLEDSDTWDENFPHMHPFDYGQAAVDGTLYS